MDVEVCVYRSLKTIKQQIILNHHLYSYAVRNVCIVFSSLYWCFHMMCDNMLLICFTTVLLMLRQLLFTYFERRDAKKLSTHKKSVNLTNVKMWLINA